MTWLIVILLGLISLLAISLQKAYGSIPIRELKRRARNGDEVADALYKAAAYGTSLRAILWLFIGLSTAGFFVFAAQNMPAIVALFWSAVLVWLGFVWMPAHRVTKLSNRIAKTLAPVFAWVLNYLHPIIDAVYNFLRRHYPISIHTGLYDKTDLVNLLERQAEQPDNRINEVELGIARNALTVGDKQVRDVLIPRRAVKMVGAQDVVGPILMTELHESGFSRFPVYEGREDNIIGTLYMHDLVTAKSGGQIKNITHQDVVFIHEEQSLIEALQAILRTRHHLFVVVNNFEEYVGIITIEDVLEQIIGRPIVDEFDAYDDMRQVAQLIAAKEHKKHAQEEKVASGNPEVVE